MDGVCEQQSGHLLTHLHADCRAGTGTCDHVTVPETDRGRRQCACLRGGRCLGTNTRLVMRGLKIFPMIPSWEIFWYRHRKSLRRLTEKNNMIDGQHVQCVSEKKRHPFYFCDNFIRCRPILLIFGRNIHERICSMTENIKYNGRI